MIGAERNSGLFGPFGIPQIVAVYYRAAFRGFDVDKLHARVLGDTLPVDDALMMRHVDAVVVSFEMSVVRLAGFDATV